MKACQIARRRLSDAMDGQPLGFFAGLYLRIHLANCEHCRRVRRSLELTRDALHGLRDPPPDGV